MRRANLFRMRSDLDHPALSILRSSHGCPRQFRADRRPALSNHSLGRIAVRWSNVEAFPAILDTGNSFSFSIREEQLEAWAGVQAGSLPRAGTIEINRRKQVVRVADLALWRNSTRQRDVLRGPFNLELPRGIAVYTRNEPMAPRLPLLGMRTFVHNRLAVKIDGRRLTVTINRPLFGGR
jgi:hypothetical protein